VKIFGVPIMEQNNQLKKSIFTKGEKPFKVQKLIFYFNTNRQNRKKGANFGEKLTRRDFNRIS